MEDYTSFSEALRPPSLAFACLRQPLWAAVKDVLCGCDEERIVMLNSSQLEPSEVRSETESNIREVAKAKRKRFFSPPCLIIS